MPSFIVDFDSYTNAERAKITQAYQFVHHKTTHAGLPVYIDRIGKLDLPGLKVAYGSQERFMQFLVCYGECTMQYRFPACSLAAGKYIGKGVYIVDLTGFALSNFNSEMRAFLKAFNGVFGDNYPESVEKMFIINAPLMFRTVWSFIGPLMDKRTRDKTSILGGQKDFLPKLLEWLPAENLPVFLGGKDTSCDFIHEKGPWAESFPAGHLFASGPRLHQL